MGRRIIARNVRVIRMSLEDWVNVIAEIIKEHPSEEAKNLTDEEIRKIARKAVGLEE